MNELAKKPFHIANGFGVYKYLDKKGYAIKKLTIGFNGVLIANCDDRFTLINIVDEKNKLDVIAFLFKMKLAYKIVAGVKWSDLTRHLKLDKNDLVF